MSPLRLSDEEAASLRAVVLLQRFSLGLDRVAQRALGGSENADVQALLVVAAHDGVSPSGLVAALGRPRSTVSRALARLLEGRLVERRTQGADRRRAELSLTERGRVAVERFEKALSDYFDEGAPLVKEVLLLLGRDPESARRDPAAGVREVADRMGAAGGAFVHDVGPVMSHVGVSEPVDRYALMALAQGWARPTQLGDELALSPAGTTGLLARLEEVGLVARESGGLDADRRAVVVHLTPRGRRVARSVLEVFRVHQESILDALEPTVAHVGGGTLTG